MTKLPTRQEVPLAQTWNLNDIFANDEIFYKELDTAEAMLDSFVTTYEGNIASIATPEALLQMLNAKDDLESHLSRVEQYPSLANETDQKSEHIQSLLLTLEPKFPVWESKLAFFTSEIVNIDKKVFADFVKAHPVYECKIASILRQKEHMLTPETERIFAMMKPELLRGNYGTYSTAMFADLSCPDFEANGKTYSNSLVQYENDYAESKDTELRRAAFASFSKGLENYHHTIGALYQRHVQNEKLVATMRGYDSVFDFLLESQNVSAELYNRQIDVLMQELSPIMRRFAKVLKRELGVEKLHYSDLKASLATGATTSISFEDAGKMAVAALSVLGKDYEQTVASAFSDRWIDWSKNEGKTTGGFCSHVPDVHPYILMSYNGSISEVFTLVHELGHAISDVLSERHVPRFANDFSLYAVEAPSTCNELLLASHLRKTSANKELLREVTIMQLQNTYYHNFVTHFLEAAYQREVYRSLDRGEALGVNDFDRLFKSVLEQFWGDAVILDAGAELTWMRQPHYYMGLYSYTYSAGLTIATAASQKLVAGDRDAIDAWLKTITYGCSMAPLQFAQTAGVDISTPEPLRATLAYISDLVAELE